jgi:hypothetical protein
MFLSSGMGDNRTRQFQHSIDISSNLVLANFLFADDLPGIAASDQVEPSTS